MHSIEHEKSSLRKFGKGYAEIHIFLDHYYPIFSFSHRMLLHHQLGIDLIVEKFGEYARKPAEQHIIEDVGEVPEDWKFYGDPFFLKLEEYSIMENELRKLYGEIE
jgi:hypothetical protein